jgi:hypothetical protein
LLVIFSGFISAIRIFFWFFQLSFIIFLKHKLKNYQLLLSLNIFKIFFNFTFKRLSDIYFLKVFFYLERFSSLNFLDLNFFQI